MDVFKFFRLVLIAVGIFVVLVFSVIALWLAPSKIGYELKKNILSSLPIFPRAFTQSRYDEPGNLLKLEIHTISLSLPSGNPSEVFNFYKGYLLFHGWREYTPLSFGQRFDSQNKIKQMVGYSEFDKKIWGISDVVAYMRLDEFYDNGKPTRTDFSLKLDDTHAMKPSEYFKSAGLTEIDMSPPGLRPQIIPSNDIDQRCTFPGQYKVVKYQNLYLLANSTGIGDLQAYGNYYDNVEYFPDRSKALAWGNNAQMTLLDFKTCQTTDFPPGFTFNKALFMQSLRSISPDGKFVVYEVFHGYTTPPFPGTENNYSAADAAKNGIWLYNLQNNKNSQLRKLVVDSDVKDLKITWSLNQLTLTGINCSQGGCIFDLQSRGAGN